MQASLPLNCFAFPAVDTSEATKLVILKGKGLQDRRGKARDSTANADQAWHRGLETTLTSYLKIEHSVTFFWIESALVKLKSNGENDAA